MVKADPKRNYYADLEVAPDVDAEEIRKQFRKLALKWHPDRNPGREAECVPRFQAIQAAHEILGDPAERTRYDLERRKRGGGPGVYTQRQPAPRGNPYQAHSHYPPPPRRTGPQRPGATSQQNAGSTYTNASASSGASRFSSFPKPPPTQRKDADHQKANVFTAWQNMKPKTNTHTSQAESSHQRAKSAWEHTQEANKPGVNRSQSTRGPKRGGFDPTTPGADEPPAASTSSYFTTSNYGRPVPPPPPPPRDPPAAHPPQPSVDPLRQFKEQFQQQESAYPEGMRTRTPYNSSSGERTFIDPVRRSASQRSSPQRDPGSAHADVSGASAARHHSASPPRRKGNATRPFAMYSSSEDDEPPKPTPKASRQNRTGSVDSSSQPTQSNGFNASDMNGGMGQKSKSSMYDHFFPDNPSKRDNPVTPNIKIRPRNWPYWAVPSSLPPRYSSQRPPAEPVGKIRKRSATNSGSPSHPSQRYRNSKHANQDTSFSIPIDTETFARTDGEQFPGNSAENINTKFSPKDWHGKFEGKPDYFTNPIPATGNRAKKSPTRPPSSRANSMHNLSSMPGAQMPQPTPPLTAQTPGGEPGPVRFSPNEWAKTFKDPSFVLPTEPPKTASPVKGPAPMRGRKQSRTRPAGANVKPKPASVADADESSEGAESTNDAAATDSSAMDIDPVPPVPQTNGTQRLKIVPTPISQARTAQREQVQGNTQAKPEETDESLRFKEFANVAPFTSTSQEGLRNLDDLSQNLPFESRPAASHPTRSAEPAALSLPLPPKAPEIPTQLTMGVWRELLPKMALYVKGFQQFDSYMLQHFAARQHEVDAMGGAINWLGAAGDLTTTGGFSSYMRGIKEDERAREQWKVGWEKHRNAMDLFEAARARVMRGGLPA
ncbi:uncharacterized protein BKCO1_3000278 [Diplodia corticola]|uniref:J domain-containing protein n=1 Tax=Diplodia corticola TaxID=236234 RepID=A0A1J9SF10_9PEZI|nr:uncharacterized protein BKCO1_3000278 [Diplodia corticola]OJD38999.1 hypothetical protein BKCO1_3000278 [Diplodia corticola]